MACKAVIFDMFGTLVQNLGDDFIDVLDREGVLAELEGPNRGDFGRAWYGRDAMRLRAMGMHKTPAEMFSYVCGAIGCTLTAQALQRACEVRAQYYVRSLAPLDHAVETLRKLRERGLRLGLLSVCSAELPLEWTSTPFSALFHATAFSCDTGLSKPDPRFYELLCEKLGVLPGDCFYVGDGDAQELTGAQKLGMTAILICHPQEEHNVMRREEARLWRGLRIESLSQLPEIIPNPNS